MLRILFPGRDFSLGTFIIRKFYKNINRFFCHSLILLHSPHLTPDTLPHPPRNLHPDPELLLFPAFSYSARSRNHKLLHLPQVPEDSRVTGYLLFLSSLRASALRLAVLPGVSGSTGTSYTFLFFFLVGLGLILVH